MKKRNRGNPIPLIVEDHPDDYDGYPFITLIQYRNEHYLTLVDNADDKHIRSFVLDLCGPTGVNEEQVIEIASEWWDEHRENYPISFEFSKAGLSKVVSPIYQKYQTEYVTRVIGPLPKFNMGEVVSIKRRKRKPVPVGMEVHLNAPHLHLT